MSFEKILEDSATYQWILNKGREEGRARAKLAGRFEVARHFVMRFGTQSFGTPPAATVAALDAITDLERLERMVFAALDTAVNWDSILATP